MARYALATIALANMPGGLERNLIALANHLAHQGHAVRLLTFDQPGGPAFYPIHPSVAWHRLGRNTPHQRIGFAERLALIWRMREALLADGRPDRLVVFHHGLLSRWMAARLFTGIPVICSERNALALYDHVRQRKWNRNFLMLFLTCRITVQFPNYVSDYPAPLRPRIAVVPNPVAGLAAHHGAAREPLILSVGRLCAQKRFDLLIRACALVFRFRPDWRLIIVGSGPLQAELEALIDRHALGERITLTPPRPDLSDLYARATLYCQPSQWEGFPNAQAEAMAAGVIPVGFADTRGVADLIEPGVSGFLCQGAATPEALAETLLAATGEVDRLPAMSRHAAEVRDRYSPDRWAAAWDAVLHA